MSGMDAVLETAKKTSDTLAYLENNAMGNNPLLGHNFDIASLSPPPPFKPRARTAKVTNNDGLLKNEISNLKDQLSAKNAECESLKKQIADSYKVVSGFREEFEAHISEVADSLVEKVCEFQNGVWENMK